MEGQINRVILLSLCILAAVSGNELAANTFQNGCLRFMDDKNNEKHLKHSLQHFLLNERVCNSDDVAKGNNNCGIPEFQNYKEVRIGSGDRHGGSLMLVSMREGHLFLTELGFQ